MDLLEDERLVIGHSQPLEVDGRSENIELQSLGHCLACRLDTRGHDSGARVEAVALHLLGKAERPGEVMVDPLPEHVRAATTGPLDASLAGELAEGVPNGDQAAAVAAGQLPLRR